MTGADNDNKITVEMKTNAFGIKRVGLIWVALGWVGLIWVGLGSVMKNEGHSLRV